MKHNLKVTIFLLLLFIIIQFLGLYVVDFYSPTKIIDNELQNVSAPNLPYGMQTPEIEQEKDFYSIFPSIIFAFIFAIFLFFILTKYKAALIIKLWFLLVIIISVGISFRSFFPVNFENAAIISLTIAIPLGLLKVFYREPLLHNFTEIFIYPGIAAVFVPLLNFWTIMVLLILISVYDIWAVWHSGIMQKMAKYQIDKLQIFSGLFVPYLSKKQKEKFKKLKKSKNPNSKKSKFKVNVALLGGGDIIFPIITAGVVLKTASLGVIPAISTIVGATFGLSYLFFFAKKKKFYPAMPYITAGIFLGIGIGKLLVLL